MPVITVLAAAAQVFVSILVVGTGRRPSFRRIVRATLATVLCFGSMMVCSSLLLGRSALGVEWVVLAACYLAASLFVGPTHLRRGTALLLLLLAATTWWLDAPLGYGCLACVGVSGGTCPTLG